MNKTILATLAVAAVAGLSACTQTSVVTPANQGAADREGISFRPFAGASVRAAEFDRDAMKMDGFTVAAFRNDNGAMFFGKENVKPADATKLEDFWDIQDKEYQWPNFKLDFYAYANVDEADNVTLTGGDTGKKEMTLATDAKVADQEDIIVAYNYGTRDDHETSGVPMKFKHILSQVAVQAKDSKASDHQYTIEVAGVKLGRIASEGKFTYPAKNSYTAFGTDKAFASSLITLTDNKVSSFFAGAATVATLNATTPVSLMNTSNGNFMIIPQDTEAWNQEATYGGGTAGTDNGKMYLGVRVRIKSKAGAAIYPVDGNFAFATTPLDYKFEPGKKYLITVDFKDGAGYEEPAIEGTDPANYDDRPKVDDTQITISENPVGENNDKPGRPILGGPIRFKVVEVESWGDATGVDLPMIPAATTSEP